MVTSKPSPVVEDYVTLVWKSCEWPGGRATTTGLADRLGVTLSTVSANLKKLAKAGLIDYEPYGAITLTERGSEIATRIVHRHRIIETYLATQVGMRWDEVHEEADRLEHAVSDRLLDRMDDALGRPDFDPHGDPIPRHGCLPQMPASMLLVETPAGVQCTIVRVSDRHPEILRYLSEKGLALGSTVVVRSSMDVSGAMHLSLGDAVLEVSATAAAAVRVTHADAA